MKAAVFAIHLIYSTTQYLELGCLKTSAWYAKMGRSSAQQHIGTSIRLHPFVNFANETFPFATMILS